MLACKVTVFTLLALLVALGVPFASLQPAQIPQQNGMPVAVGSPQPGVPGTSIPLYDDIYRCIGPQLLPLTDEIRQVFSDTIRELYDAGPKLGENVTAIVPAQAVLESPTETDELVINKTGVTTPGSSIFLAGGQQIRSFSSANPSNYSAIDISTTEMVTPNSLPVPGAGPAGGLPGGPGGVLSALPGGMPPPGPTFHAGFASSLEASLQAKGYQVDCLTLSMRTRPEIAPIFWTDNRVPHPPTSAYRLLLTLVGPDVTPFTVEKQSLLLDAWKPLGLADPSLNILWRRVLAFHQINSTAIEVALVFVQALPSGPGSPGSAGSSPGGTPITTIIPALAASRLEGQLAASGFPVEVTFQSLSSQDGEDLQLGMPTGGLQKASPAPGGQAPNISSQGGPSPQSQEASSGGVSPGAIGGIIAAAVVAGLLLAVLGAFLVRRRRRQREFSEASDKFELGDARSDLGGGPFVGGNSGSGGYQNNSLISTQGSMGLSAWDIDPEQIEIYLRPDGSPWLLGKGSFGSVYRGVRGGTTDVAVKKLDNADAGTLRQFQKEISILAGLSFDRNIVQFYGACTSGPDPMLVLEYMEGGDLREALSGSNSSELGWYRKGHKVALDIARGLVFLHANHVVHSDLKTKNVLLTNDLGTAKIADVGLARIMKASHGSSSSALAGTFAWAAPEVLLGERWNEKADIYSFGVTLWELITGDVPVRGHLRQVKVPEQCPAAIAKLISQCLVRRGNRRPSAKQAFDVIARVSAAGPPPTAASRLRDSASVKSLNSDPRSGSETSTETTPFSSSLYPSSDGGSTAAGDLHSNAKATLGSGSGPPPSPTATAAEHAAANRKAGGPFPEGGSDVESESSHGGSSSEQSGFKKRALVMPDPILESNMEEEPVTRASFLHSLKGSFLGSFRGSALGSVRKSRGKSFDLGMNAGPTPPVKSGPM